MIWVINHISEYDPTFPTFRYYQEVIGRDNIRLYCAGDRETFDFLNENDIVLLRSGDAAMVDSLIKRQKVVGFKSTIEDPLVIATAYDKAEIKGILAHVGIRTPKTYRLEDVEDGKTYFVKPRFGEDSKFVDLNSVCHTKKEVCTKCNEMVSRGITPIIEQYIEGKDCTVGVIRNAETAVVQTYAIDVEVDNLYAIQTQEVKSGTIAYCEPTKNPLVNEICKEAFDAIGAKHYMRIDFRIDRMGVPYLIDLNIFPGFGIAGYMYRSLMLCANKSYRDFIKDIIASAS